MELIEKHPGKVLLFVMVVAVLVGGWVDGDNTKEVPRYTIICDNHELTETCVIMEQGKTVADISMTEASELNMFSQPENIETWVEGK